MEAIKPAKPRIFIDAGVRFAGTASPNEHSASNMIWMVYSSDVEMDTAQVSGN
jgi:hypothetical protein